MFLMKENFIAFDVDDILNAPWGFSNLKIKLFGAETVKTSSQSRMLII